MNDYLEKLNKLPKEVRMYFDPEKSSELNLLICERNGLKNEDIGKNTDLISELFFKDLKLEELTEKIKSIFKFSDTQAKKLANDIVGIRLLIVDKWFEGQASQYLKNANVNLSEYEKITTNQIEAVKKELEEIKKEEQQEKAEQAKTLKGFAAVKELEPEKEIKDFKIDWSKEKKEMTEIFENGLVNILSSGDEWLEDFNDVLVYLLVENGNVFRDSLERLLLDNKENLTEKHFSLSGHLVEPTIGNWLNYFIKQKGTGNFDNISLTDFMVNSPATKKLKTEEKEIVKKLLMFYRNLKFFPESMPNDTGVGWQIIPFKQEEGESEELTEAKARLEKEKEIINQPAVERAKKIAELKAQADSYSPRSLERRALEEEIKKLE